MRESKILELAELYHACLAKDGRSSKKYDEMKYVEPGGDTDIRNHLAWACNHIRVLVTESQFPSGETDLVTHQWLGFIQGCLWLMGDFTIEELRQHEHDGCTYDPIGGGGGHGRSDLPAGSRGDED